ncbi:beta-lactamase [Pseudomonas stutzeri]|nr:class C beta-lactamase [Stutzerimonas stutzeri]MCQ4330418.1 beta-lactamase [Stutzerimonas stutzeri]
MADTEHDPIDATVADAAQTLMAQYAIPGLAIAVTVQGKQYFYNYGVASNATQQAVTRETLFEIGSVSKTLTATLAAYAEAQGKLSLTDSPTRYLPTLQGSKLDQITLIDLATHTAGDFPLQLPDDIRNDRQLTNYFRAWQPHYAPGTRHTYANPGMGLLGMAAASSLGLSYVDALQTQLLPKLGMRNTFIDVPSSEMARYAQGYNKDGDPVRLNPALLANEAYGAKTTSQDLLHFIEAQLGAVETDSLVRQAIKTTRTGYYQVGAMTQALVWEQYEYPVALDDLLVGNGSKMVLESQPVKPISLPLQPQTDAWVNKTGSTNGFGAYVAFIPARQLGIVILANRYYPNEERVKLAYRILGQLAQ